MTEILVIASIIGLIVSITMIVKFFQIASDMRELKVMALNDYRLKLLTTPENCELKKLIADINVNEVTLVDDLPNWIKLKLGEGAYATAEKEFDIWHCTNQDEQKFYFKNREDVIKALCYFQTQK